MDARYDVVAGAGQRCLDYVTKEKDNSGNSKKTAKTTIFGPDRLRKDLDVAEVEQGDRHPALDGDSDYASFVKGESGVPQLSFVECFEFRAISDVLQFQRAAREVGKAIPFQRLDARFIQTHRGRPFRAARPLQLQSIAQQKADDKKGE